MVEAMVKETVLAMEAEEASIEAVVGTGHDATRSQPASSLFETRVASILLVARQELAAKNVDLAGVSVFFPLKSE